MRAAGRNHRSGQTAGGPAAGTDDHYKWVALPNTTAAVFMSALDGSMSPGQHTWEAHDGHTGSDLAQGKHWRARRKLAATGL